MKMKQKYQCVGYMSYILCDLYIYLLNKQNSTQV